MPLNAPLEKIPAPQFYYAKGFKIIGSPWCALIACISLMPLWLL